MTTDTDALQERIAEELYYDQHPEGRHRSEWPAVVYPDTAYECRDLAAAVLPIIAAEVKSAKAEAWDEGYLDRSPYGGRARSRADNPYRAAETGDRA